MDFIRTLLEQQPLTALFLTIALGYIVGEINFKGFSLGVGAVLFVALGMGWFAPKATPAPMLGTFGLSLFLYAVGIQYGKQFCSGLTSADGLRANLLAVIGVASSGVATLLLIYATDLKPAYALGLFAGSNTSTPSLQAAIATLGNDDPAVGYSVAYPFGVAGPILFLAITFAIWTPKIDMPSSSGMEILEITLQQPALFGLRLVDLIPTLPKDVRISAIRRAHHNQPATADLILEKDDVLLLVAPNKDVLKKAEQILGKASPGRLTQDRRDLDYLRVFASGPKVSGQMLRDLALPGDNASIVVHVRRGDAELLATPELVLEYGDRVGIFANRADFPALRKYFGDSIKGTAEFSYVSIGLGMALGFVVGAIKIPIPGVATITLGLSGVLIVALLLGRWRRTGRLSWYIPPSANLVLRNLGLTVFLAQVGIASGPKFAATVAETGILLLALGAVVLAALVVPVILLGLFVFRMPFDRVSGVVAGACGNPAILAYLNKLSPSDQPDVLYATTYPGMTILKILFVSIVAARL